MSESDLKAVPEWQSDESLAKDVCTIVTLFLALRKGRGQRKSLTAASEEGVPAMLGVGLVSLQLAKAFAMSRTKAKVNHQRPFHSYESEHLIPIFRGIGRTFS